MYHEESVVLGHARRPAPLKVRLSFSSTAQPFSSNLLPREVSPLLKYCRTPWPVQVFLVSKTIILRRESSSVSSLTHARTVDEELLHLVLAAKEEQLAVSDVEDGICPSFPVGALGVELAFGKVQDELVLRSADLGEVDWGG